MGFLKKFISLIFIAQVFCCVDSKKTPLSNKATVITENKLVDTILSSYSFRIVNDMATLNILKINNEMNNHFILKLDYKDDIVFTKILDKKNVILENQSRVFLDTIHNDYVLEAKIKDIEFMFTRGNALYFKSILENTTEQKNIFGRFNVFYKSDKKGIVYGWITDEVKDFVKN